MIRRRLGRRAHARPLSTLTRRYMAHRATLGLVPHSPGDAGEQPKEATE